MHTLSYGLHTAIFPTVSFQCTLSHGLYTASSSVLCSITGINFAHVKIPKSRTIVWTLENTAHLGTSPEDGIRVDVHVAEEVRTDTDAVRLPKTNV